MIGKLFEAKKWFERFLFNVKYKGKFKGQDFHSSFQCDNFEGLSFGRRCYIGPNCHFDALGGIDIQDYSIVGPHVRIWSYNHDIKSELIPYGPENKFSTVRIGKGVWIAMGVIILPGAEIGEGSVIAAGSIVKGKVPPFSIVRPPYAQPEPIEIVKKPGAYYRGE